MGDLTMEAIKKYVAEIEKREALEADLKALGEKWREHPDYRGGGRLCADELEQLIKGGK